MHIVSSELNKNLEKLAQHLHNFIQEMFSEMQFKSATNEDNENGNKNMRKQKSPLQHLKILFFFTICVVCDSDLPAEGKKSVIKIKATQANEVKL